MRKYLDQPKSTLGRRLVFQATIIAMIVSTGVVSTTAVAQAVAGYHTSGTNVRVRAGANTQTAQINSIASAGTPLDMECQTAGQTVTASGFGTSSVWDKLYGYGGYISDLFVRETPYAQFDSRIPRCGAATAQPPAPTYRTSVAVTQHTAPSFNATISGNIAAGTPVSISCQNYGTAVGGSFIWDRIGSAFISDLYVNGTPFNAFDSRIPRCGLNFQPVDCSHTLFIGARGSAEDLGSESMGTPGATVMETYLRLKLRRTDVDPGGVNYTAYPVEFLYPWYGPYYLGVYMSGVDDGTKKTLDVLRARTDGNVCGWEHTKTVLVGYSSGAWAVGNAIDQMTPQERQTIRGVVTYGNPRFNPSANGASGWTGQGIRGARGPYPDGVNTRSRDYCRQDVVCKGIVGSWAEHTRYVDPGPEVDNGVTFLSTQI
ncbi:cutinase family protein [Arthrobacter sp. KBS0703]|uniref:cutinase family protein n=1 Tax=Arthrobacter sp. KBS0703 TaxID=1955698 RepID=UPI00098F2780|nr:cutinase family protein [Arthrobacter sp. KBS0703]TSE15689.1 cutinase family protein [Arthrobacter sp. KBS0703]